MMQINKLSDLSLQIFFPNFNQTTPFVLEFYTNATCLPEDPFLEPDPKKPNSNIVRASYSPENGYKGCTPWSSGVYLCAKNTMNDKGDLHCRASFKNIAPHSESGVQLSVLDFKTDIEIVTNGGTRLSPVMYVETLLKPSYNSINSQPIVEILFPKNDTGLCSVDYSSTVEQTLVGQFGIGGDGSRKQLYGRRICLSGKLIDYVEKGGGCCIANLVYADTVFEIIGSYAIDDSYINEQYSWNTFFLGSLNNKMQFVFLKYPSWIYTPNRLGLQLLTGNKEAIGANYKIDIFIKYTKF